MRRPGDDPPPLPARDENERKQIIEWAHEKIDAWQGSLLKEGNETTWRDIAISLARAGNVESLRKLYPDIAEFIFPPKLKRGQHKTPRIPEPDKTMMALTLVAFVQEIWKGRYGQPNNYGRGATPSAVDIVVEYLAPEEVSSAMEREELISAIKREKEIRGKNTARDLARRGVPFRK